MTPGTSFPPPLIAQDRPPTPAQVLPVPPQPPSIDEAKKYREESSIRSAQGGARACFWLTVSSQQLGAYGVGVQLYFAFLKSAAILFFFISVLSTRPLLLNYRGNYLLDGQTKTPFDVYTLANQDGPDIYEKKLSVAEEYVDSTQQNQQETLLFDVIYSLSFLVFLKAFSKVSDNIRTKNREAYEQPSDYAVEVWGLPSNATEEEVRLHFEQQFGEVVEVSLARKYDGKLLLYKRRSELTIKLQAARVAAKEKGIQTSAQVTKLQRQISNFDKKIAKKNRKLNVPSSKRPVLRAFVVFNQYIHKVNCYEAYSNAYHWFRSQPSYLQFRGIYPISVQEPPEPSVILWENLEVWRFSRTIRQICTTILTCILLGLTVAMIFGLNTANVKMPSAFECREQEMEDLSFEQAQEKYATPEEKLCWCLLKGITTVLRDSDLGSFCEEYVSIWQESTYIRIAYSICIVIVNFILKYAMRKICDFERRCTVSDLQHTIMVKLFLATSINTTFISLCFTSQDEYFTRNWYLNVGSGHLITMLVCMFSPHILNLIIFYPAKHCRIACCRRRKKTQSELNQLYLGPAYDLASKMAVALNIISSCFYYSGGIPLLNVVCFVSLVVIYWIEKFLIVHHYRKPPHFNQKLNTSALIILFFILLSHCIFSLFMYTSETIWPAEYYQNSDGMIVGRQSEKQKTTRPAFIVILLLIFVIFAVYYSDRYGKDIIQYFQKMCMPNFNKTKNLSQTYVQARASMSQRGIDSYSIYANPDYKDLVEALDQSAATQGNTLIYTHSLESPKVASEHLFEVASGKKN